MYRRGGLYYGWGSSSLEALIYVEHCWTYCVVVGHCRALYCILYHWGNCNLGFRLLLDGPFGLYVDIHP